MKNKTYLLNTFLAAIVAVYLLVCLFVRAFCPAVILPKANIPNLVLLSLVALVLEHYLVPGAKRCYICIPVLGAVSFALLPLMAGFACQHDFWKFGLVGGAVFTVTTFLFTSLTDRLTTGPKAQGAVIISALGIYLAAQCFAGIIL